jgi:hypothetical protein
VFLETSPTGAGSAGDNAFLDSPMIPGYGRILAFYYHMFGTEIGTLNVDVYDGVWHNGLWSLSGQQHSSSNDGYTQAFVDLTGFTGLIRIRFRAVSTGGSRGDMAVDDIQVLGRRVYGDMNADNIVDGNDLPDFAANWLQTNCDLDVDGDCVIALPEFAEFAKNWVDDSF